jgi:cysteine desulfurase
LPARAYLDHASTSPPRPEVTAAVIEWLTAADPGRVHTEGRMARAAIEDARAKVASLFGTRPRQVIFTSGATESINAAVYGAMTSGRGDHVVLSRVEHSAVRAASQRWHQSVVGCDRLGRIDVEAAVSAIEPTTGLMHCQWANHEVGTLQPVPAVVSAVSGSGDSAGSLRPLVHVDAASAAGHVPIDFDGSGVDLMSISAHKLGGPKGVGALLVRRGLRIPPLLVGGDQERSRRAGLEDVAAIMGFGAAAELLVDQLDREAARARAQTGRLLAEALRLPAVAAFGDTADEGRLPHLICLGVQGVEAEAVLLGLDQAGVAAHSGSACSSESLEPSPVLEAMGVDAERSLRLSVGWSTTDADIDLALAALPDVIQRLRALAAGAGP